MSGGERAVHEAQDGAGRERKFWVRCRTACPAAPPLPPRRAGRARPRRAGSGRSTAWHRRPRPARPGAPPVRSSRHLDLQGVRVLELVDDHQPEPLAEVAAHRLAVAQGVARLDQEVEEVEDAASPSCAPRSPPPPRAPRCTRRACRARAAGPPSTRPGSGWSRRRSRRLLERFRRGPVPLVAEVAGNDGHRPQVGGQRPRPRSGPPRLGELHHRSAGARPARLRRGTCVRSVAGPRAPGPAARGARPRDRRGSPRPAAGGRAGPRACGARPAQRGALAPAVRLPSGIPESSAAIRIASPATSRAASHSSQASAKRMSISRLVRDAEAGQHAALQRPLDQERGAEGVDGGDLGALQHFEGRVRSRAAPPPVASCPTVPRSSRSRRRSFMVVAAFSVNVTAAISSSARRPGAHDRARCGRRAAWSCPCPRPLPATRLVP